MATNYKQPGDVIEVTVGQTFASGRALYANGMVGVFLKGGENGDTLPFQIKGVFTLTKNTAADVIAIGDALYLDSDGEIDPAYTEGLTDFIGYAVSASGNGTTTVDVLLVGGNSNTGVQVANIAELDQNISGTYVEAEVQAISDKVDALLAALKTAGVMIADLPA
jgi:predicted RecA/RadA family phage recombinase